MDNTDKRILEAFGMGQKFDEDVRTIMRRALKLDELEAENNNGDVAVGLMAVDVAVSLANVLVAIRRPAEGRTFRAIFDFSISLNNNPFWTRHVGEMMPLLRMCLMDHLDSISLQMERGDDKISPYDKLIMGAEATPLALFSVIAYLFGGSALQMSASVDIKKQLMPLLMK